MTKRSIPSTPPQPSVTVGIPAHNEAQAIGRLVASLLDQEPSNFVLEAIIVNSDGSTDATVAVCHALHSPKVQVVDNATRRGKAVRQTELFRLNQSDIHINFDADVFPAHRFVLAALVSQFSDGVGVVGGIPKPLYANTLVERICIKEMEIWRAAVNQVRGGINIYNHEGRISALAGSVAARIEIPEGISGTDDYVYLLRNG